jgi:hypothetical protein
LKEKLGALIQEPKNSTRKEIVVYFGPCITFSHTPVSREDQLKPDEARIRRRLQTDR